ncbi:MAG TPA: Calx-beta domain-containing protein, partial [Gemmataceae bacterium]|nr:Calx-beta domain-containing protein [Gemmataceae bacterium]
APPLADGVQSLTATATDPGGKTSLPSAPLVVTVDTTGPAVTINQAAGQADPTAGSPVAFTVHFDEPVTGFTAADVNLAGSTVGGALVAAVTGSGQDYTVTVTGMTGTGTVVANVPAGVALDAAGNPGAASTSTDNAVAFDGDAPTVTIDQAPAQAEPATAGPVAFAVHFTEPVTGFDAADVDLSASTVDGTLVATVTGSGADYTVTVTGMFGAGAVVASIPAGAATDAVGHPNAASTSTDNAVAFNHVGTITFADPVYATSEEGGTVTLTVFRLDGGDGPATVRYATADGSAKAAGDYGPLSDTLRWEDGDSTPRTIVVPIVNDTVSEGDELFRVTLSAPTGGAVLGPQAEARVKIARSDGTEVDGAGTKPQAAVTEADGDGVTVKLAGKVGKLTYYLTDGAAPFSAFDLADTDAATSVVTVAVKKAAGGDGRTTLGAIDGSAVKSLALAKVDLTGPGIALTAAASGKGTKIVLGVIGDGTDVTVTGTPLASLTAIAIGDGTIAAPSVGTIAVKGKGKTIAGDFRADLIVAGTGLAAGTPAVKALRVAGAVSGASIRVGGAADTVGD